MTRHHVTAAGNRAPPSIWPATNGCRTPAEPIWFMLRINMQHYSCDFAPVSTLRIRVEQAQIRDDVLFVA
jgi:hypothetical protein